MTKCEVFGVYLIVFKINEGGELSNKHYGLVLTKMSSSDKTFLVAPMTSKKEIKDIEEGLLLFVKNIKIIQVLKKHLYNLEKFEK